MRKFVRMRIKPENNITIKRVKKDGSINKDIVAKVAVSICNGGVVILPIDSVYGIVGLSVEDIGQTLSGIFNSDNIQYESLISSFKTLDTIADFSKSDYDFLNRIWPGEISVTLKAKSSRARDKIISIRYPRNKFLHDIIDLVEHPVFCANIFDDKNKIIYKKKDIINIQKHVDLVLIIDEMCKRHPLPTSIDISENKLTIIHEGKVAVEEIKSLYFLGKSDGAVYW